jgi:hypothetical protein
MSDIDLFLPVWLMYYFDYSIHLHPIDHYNDQEHVTRNNTQYISKLTDILAMYGIIT